jgi:hypothetical protein
MRSIGGAAAVQKAEKKEPELEKEPESVEVQIGGEFINPIELDDEIGAAFTVEWLE